MTPTNDLSNFTETRSSVHSKLRNGGAKGRGGRNTTTGTPTTTTNTSTTTTASSSNNATTVNNNSNTPSTSPTAFLPPRAEKRKSKDESPAPMNGNTNSNGLTNSNAVTPQSLVNPVTGLNVQISAKKCKSTASPCAISPVLLECPEQDCSKKYKNSNGLKYHQSHAHGSVSSMDEDSSQLPESPQRVAPPTTPSPIPTVQTNQNSATNITSSGGTGVANSASGLPLVIGGGTVQPSLSTQLQQQQAIGTNNNNNNSSNNSNLNNSNNNNSSSNPSANLIVPIQPVNTNSTQSVNVVAATNPVVAPNPITPISSNLSLNLTSSATTTPTINNSLSGGPSILAGTPTATNLSTGGTTTGTPATVAPQNLNSHLNLSAQQQSISHSMISQQQQHLASSGGSITTGVAGIPQSQQQPPLNMTNSSILGGGGAPNNQETPLTPQQQQQILNNGITSTPTRGDPAKSKLSLQLIWIL